MSLIDQAKQNINELLSNTSGSLKTQACLMTAPEISCPTGKKAVKKKELILLDGTSVDSKKVTGGSLEWFPQDELTDFGTLRKQAYKVFDDFGVSLGGMYLVALEHLEEVLEKLSVIRSNWDTKVEQLTVEFDDVLSRYKQDNPEISKLVEDYKLPKQDFMNVFEFRVSPPLAIQPLFPEQEGELEKQAIERLWDDIAKEANRRYLMSFSGKESVSRKAINGLLSIRDKLVKMSFLDDGIDLVLDTFDNMMLQLPKTGPVEGNDYHKLGHFIVQLSDVRKLKATAAGTDDAINVSQFYQDDINAEDFDADTSAQPVSNVVDMSVISDFSDPVQAVVEDETVTQPTFQPQQSDFDWCDNF